jgi:hypothetical protein
MSENIRHDYTALSPKPSVYHRVISDEEAKLLSRLIVVGDVHGCLDELKALLQHCEYNPEGGDQVLLVGDLVNKGPYSAEVVRFVRENDMLCIRGNHDDFALCKALLLVPPSDSKSLDYINALSR